MRLPIPILLLTLGQVTQAATVGPTERFLPLIQDGGGWSSQITVTNLSESPAQVVAAFLTAGGYSEPWRPGLKLSSGRASGGTVEVSLAPGATAVIETIGAAAVLTRGFAEVVEIGDRPIGVSATLTQKDGGGQIVRSITVPYSAGHERRSVMPLDLSDPQQKPLMVWVSMTSSVVLDVTFRNLAGEVVLTDQVNLNGRAQLFVEVREQWPTLKDFRGVMQWSVTFPFADRYEPRTLGALLVLASDGRPWAALSGMTLPSDQASIEPY